jgi:DNA excision repair protein ERCC-4
VHPVVLAVGDYVLSTEICVERKSSYELIDSFASVRRFQLAEMMTRQYAKPVLLIEFDEVRIGL